MQFSTTAIVAFLASTAFAAPMAEPDRNMMATSGQQWTIQSFTRTCNAADTSCKYTYGINPRDAAVAKCNYTVTASKQASRASYNNVKCGNFVISSGWSGQFGEGNGFQTLAVVRNRQIIYPAYSDKQITNGKAVSPDQSYTPQTIPS